ncbi:MAG: hypothetical protein LBH93_04490 [Chitinispirillales bacterium]|jgi:hypothetical protein|nr:hypothetical protein [Chitinispirillales bacterium]
MDELRIPVTGRMVVIELMGGAQLGGLVFIPSAAPDHDGTMRLVEWLNAAGDFFPFQAHGEEGHAVLSKRGVLCLTAYHERDSDDYDLTDGTCKCGVAIEAGGQSFAGQLIVDTPYNNRRVLDVLNDGKQFVYLLDRGKEVHINKAFIIKVTETGSLKPKA